MCVCEREGTCVRDRERARARVSERASERQRERGGGWGGSGPYRTLPKRQIGNWLRGLGGLGFSSGNRILPHTIQETDRQNWRRGLGAILELASPASLCT